MITLATKVTIIRLAFVPVFILVALIEFPYHFLIAGLIYALVAITDFLDGTIARKTNTVSKLGKILDPIADKALQISGLVCVVVYQLFYYPVIALVMAVIIVTREIAVSVMRGMVLKQGMTLTPDIFGKLKTIFLNIAVPVVLLSASLLSEFGYNDLRYTFFKGLSSALYLVAFIFTVISAIRYFYLNKDIVKTAYKALKVQKEGDNGSDNRE